MNLERVTTALRGAGLRVSDADVDELDGVAHPLALEPGDEGEAARALATLAEVGAAAVPVGRGTRRGLGGIPAAPGVWLRTARLAGIVEYEPGDLTVTVRAGTPLSELQADLGAHGQWLPAGPPGDDGTVGGLVATGDWGPQRLLYGGARDNVIGLRVALPNGTLVRSGGKVVKNVAGYDLNKLYVGSLGSLGVIVEASFKLRPLPEARAVALLGFPRPAEVADAVGAARRVMDSELVPCALEWMSPGWSAEIGLPERHLLAVGFEDSPAAVSAQLDRIRGFGDVREVLDGAEAEQFWLRWRRVHQAAAGDGVGLRMGHPPAAAGALGDRWPALTGRHGVEGRFSFGAGSGASRGVLDGPAGSLAGAIADLRALLTEHGGWLVVERAPAEVKRALPVWGPTRGDFPLMRAIKQKFDPAGVLNPGRFVGGL